MARWRGLDRASFVQETVAGLQPIDVEEQNGSWSASMLQNEAEFGPELEGEAVMAAVGLRPEDAHPELPPQVVSTGMPHVMAPVAEHEVLARALPDYSTHLRALGAATARWSSTSSGASPDRGEARARSFTRTAEMGEDPATGSAAGPLGAYLSERTGCERVGHPPGRGDGAAERAGGGDGGRASRGWPAA